MKTLRFAKKEEAVQYLADLMGYAIRIAANATEIEEKKDDVEETLSKSQQAILQFKKTLKETKQLDKQFDDLMDEYMRVRAELVEMLKDYDEKFESTNAFVSEDAAIQHLANIIRCKIVIG